MTDTELPTAAAGRGPLSSGSPLRRWGPWALLAAVVVTVLSIATFGTRSAPTAQDRVNSIARSVRCPTCSGESVAESNAPASQEIRIDIGKRVQEGQTDARDPRLLRQQVRLLDPAQPAHQRGERPRVGACRWWPSRWRSPVW